MARLPWSPVCCLLLLLVPAVAAAPAPAAAPAVPLGPCDMSPMGWEALTGLLACWANASAGAGAWINSSGTPVPYLGRRPCGKVINSPGWDYLTKSCGHRRQRQTPLSYTWQLDQACDPQPPPWSKALVCEHHRGDVLVVGDSLSHHFLLTLHLALAASCEGVVACPNHTFRLSYVRNDHLLLTNERYFDKQRNVIVNPWYHAFLGSPGISTVVLNRGTHYTPDQVFLPQVEKVFRALREARPDILIVYRNTPAGHPNCWQGSGVHGPPTPRPYESWTEHQADLYHWRALLTQNQLVESLIRRSFPGILYWDVEQATAYRQDSHTQPNDCLHYCIPGPIDHWVESFGQLLWAVRRGCREEGNPDAPSPPPPA
eukprot:EG_transcript_15847